MDKLVYGTGLDTFSVYETDDAFPGGVWFEFGGEYVFDIEELKKLLRFLLAYKDGSLLE